jgi:hypothetical protein
MPRLASSDTVQMVQGAHGSVVQKADDTLS